MVYNTIEKDPRYIEFIERLKAKEPIKTEEDYESLLIEYGSIAVPYGERGDELTFPKEINDYLCDKIHEETIEAGLKAIKAREESLLNADKSEISDLFA